jgi:sporadic carbohydrate cluster protein (TIGR04323 family)
MKKGVRGYIFSRAFMGERIPQRVQNLVIRDYCQRNDLVYLLSATEYAMQRCSMMLKEIMLELDRLEGVVMYSIYQLPKDTSERHDIYTKVTESGSTLHFALEGLKAYNYDTFDRVETLWQIRLMLPLVSDTLSAD